MWGTVSAQFKAMFGPTCVRREAVDLGYSTGLGTARVSEPCKLSSPSWAFHKGCCRVIALIVSNGIVDSGGSAVCVCVGEHEPVSMAVLFIIVTKCLEKAASEWRSLFWLTVVEFSLWSKRRHGSGSVKGGEGMAAGV